jgi:hypothetical protein
MRPQSICWKVEHNGKLQIKLQLSKYYCISLSHSLYLANSVSDYKLLLFIMKTHTQLLGCKVNFNLFTRFTINSAAQTTQTLPESMCDLLPGHSQDAHG